ncbi:MAG: lipopolysaccharide biosynthesis protein [Paucibacter sp.]|nr:lipopolysaccharide biosynthesis protein [Roseateles sp.]
MQQGFLRATATLLAGGALAQALPLLLGPWLTRLYTPVEYGQFSFVWSVAANIGVVGCARYEFALPLEKTEEGATALLGLCLRVLGAVMVVSVIVSLIVAAVMGLKLSLALSLPIAVLASALTQALMQWATRAEAFKALAWARVVQYGGGALLQVGCGLLAWGAFGLMAGAVVAALLAVILLLRPAPLAGWLRLGAVSRERLAQVARRHRDFPLYNTPHAFAGALQDSLALWLIASMTGDANAGYWALALRYLKAPASLVGGALSQVLYPRLAQASSVDAGRQLVRQTLLALGGLGLVLMIVLMAVGPWLFTLLFGAGWTETGQLARALAPYVACHFVAAPLSVAPMAWKAQAWLLRLALVGQVMFIVGLASGLHWGGLLGAAWGVSGMMCAYFGYFFWSLARWK